VLIGDVDTSTITCGSKSSIKFLEFLWDATLIFAFLKYGIVCLPFDPPKLLYLRHHESTCGGWTRSTLCRPCLGNYGPVIDKFLPICTASSSCKCRICLRQPPSLRSLAYYTLFHITRNVAEFTLTSETTYLHYMHAVKSNLVPADKLIPDSFLQLRCKFARSRDYGGVKRYHKSCVDPSQFPWYSHTGEYSASKDEVIARLCTDKHEWWCDLCDKPLFATAECLFC